MLNFDAFELVNELPPVNYVDDMFCWVEWVVRWLCEVTTLCASIQGWGAQKRFVCWNTGHVFHQVFVGTGCEMCKQLDYILTDRKHYSWEQRRRSKWQNTHGSDHRCVMAKFEIPKEKGKPRHTKAPMTRTRRWNIWRWIWVEVERTRARSQKAGTKEEHRKRGRRNDKNKSGSSEAGDKSERSWMVDSFRSVSSTSGSSRPKIHKKKTCGKHQQELQQQKRKKRRKIRRNSGLHTRKEDHCEAWKRTNPWNQQEDQKVHQRKQKDEKTGKYRRSWKKLKEQKTSPVSNRRKSVSSSPKFKAKKAKPSRRDKVSQTYLRKFTKICTKVKNITLKKRNRALKMQVMMQDNNIKEFTTNEIQDAIDRQKKGKAKDGNGEQLKNCSDETEGKDQNSLQWDCASRRLQHRKAGEKFRVQVIYKKGGREDAGKYRPICTLPVLYKWFATVLYARLAPCLHRVQPQTKRGFGPIIDVTRTLWCTECWSSVVVSGVYFCTSARSTSQKHLIASNIQRYGTPCSATASSQLMSDVLQRLYSHQEGTVLTEKKVTRFRSKGAQSRRTHCPAYSSTQCCNTRWSDLKRWQENKKGIRLSDKTEDCLTNLRFADDVLLFSTSLERLR